MPSGTKLGPLLPSIAGEVGLEGTEVVASCSHDTAAAVAAVPAEGEEWAYISSGTWSLLGIEAPEPIVSAKGREYNFSNEIGYNGTVRFLKNITGLWIVQECRREWAKEGRNYTYDELTSMAENSEPLKCFINTAERRFVEPNDMPRKVVDYCRETGQMTPRTEGEIVRCILESLALQYHQTMLEIEMITGRRFKFFHIVGGGCKNPLLNQLTADATKLTVLAGPTEATAIGNILVQAIALGHLGSLIDLRRVVRRSFPITTCQPHNASAWQNANERFKRLTARSKTVS